MKAHYASPTLTDYGPIGARTFDNPGRGDKEDNPPPCWHYDTFGEISGLSPMLCEGQGLEPPIDDAP